MDEHVHEWVFAETKRFKGPTAIFGCIVAVASCKHCGLEMGPTQMEARLNATERLSASLHVVLDAVDYTVPNCRVNEMVGAVLPQELIVMAREALAYADILEGK